MKKRLVLVVVTILATANASSSFATETIAELSSKYTGWSGGTELYWKNGGGECVETSDSVVGHSSGVCFTLPELPEGAFMDLAVRDETEDLGFGPLSGQYVFKGAQEIFLEPLGGVKLIREPILSAGRFCGTESNIPVPHDAVTLYVIPDDLTRTDQWVCSQLNPGTTGFVSARFWTTQ